jgi:hypothetical protein
MLWSYLLELLNGTLVNTTALVDQMACVRCEMGEALIRFGRDVDSPVVVDLPESTWPITTTLI